MKLRHLGYNIYHLSDPINFELSFTMFRLQEFYESPSKRIRGRYFTLEDAIECAAKRQKHPYSDDYEFSWLCDNGGFNVPGNYVRNFFEKFKHDLTRRERRLLVMLKPVLDSGEKFYLIGTSNEDSIHHEVAHALFYLSADYKRDMKKLIRRLPYRKHFKRRLMFYDYCNNKNILDDEVQAYMTESKPSLIQSIGFKRSWAFTTKFRETLRKYIDKLNVRTDVNIVE